MKIRLILLASLLTFPGVSGVRAQEMHVHDSSEKLGRVNFPVSCSAAAQKQFNHALALLHSFQYAEAEQAFAEVTITDPSCAMSYWGIAMSNYHPLWSPPTVKDLQKGAAATEKARTLNPKTKRERDYLAAIETFYKDSDRLDHRTRARAYESAMKQIYLNYPGDNEAAIFYALALNERALVIGEAEYVDNKKLAAKILNKVLPKEPDHPGIIHYLIHSYDLPGLAYLALPAARNYAKIAPSSAHALHMPSHIFTRLGLWQDSIQSNLASAAMAKANVAKMKPGAASQDELHAFDYLVYAYLQGAQDQKAKSILDEAGALSQVDQEVFQVAYAWSAMPARYALERHRWDEAAALTLHPVSFPWDRFPFAQANIYFARAVGAARSGNTVLASEEIAKLGSIQRTLSEIKIGYDWGTQVEIQRRAAAAWLARAEGKNEEALQLLKAAADLEDTTEKHPVTPGALLPAREMLGDLLLEMKEPARALKEFETVLQTSPNRFNSLYGAARAAEASANHQKARSYFKKLVALCPHSDGSRPELQKATTYLARQQRSRAKRQT
jgi:Tetratricopeptide repeat